MKISDLKDSPDPSNSQFVKEYGISSLYIGANPVSITSPTPRGFHEFETNKRTPRDTFVVLHNLTNYLSKKKLGVNVRQGIFSTKSKHNAEVFGTEVYRFVPNDGYEMYYNPEVEDFTVHSLQGGSKGKKLNRAIESSMSLIFENVYNSVGIPRGRYTNYLKDHASEIDYENFVNSVMELSTKMIDEFLDSKGFKGINKREELYGQVKEIWENYYKDVKFYVDGLKKVEDIKAVGEDIEIITFPYNGFWLI